MELLYTENLYWERYVLSAGIHRKVYIPLRFPNSCSHKEYSGNSFCVDFQAPNRITKAIANPMSLISNAIYFSTVDLRLEHGRTRWRKPIKRRQSSLAI